MLAFADDKEMLSVTCRMKDANDDTTEALWKADDAIDMTRVCLGGLASLKRRGWC